MLNNDKKKNADRYKEKDKTFDECHVTYWGKKNEAFSQIQNKS